MSDVPPRTHPNWNAAASGQIKRPWSTLAVKIMMTRVVSEAAKDASPANVQKLGDEIYAFFLKNERIAAQDLKALFG